MTNKEIAGQVDAVQILALTIWGEARGEPVEGQVAVGCVIRNRVKRSYQSYHTICLASKQFSCWNENDPNRQHLIDMISKPVALASLPLWKQVRYVAYGILEEDLLDNTGGATHYFADSIQAPSWAAKMTYRKTIGHHNFYQERR